MPAERSSNYFWHVKRLCAAGLSDYEVSRRTGIPRPTVQRYRHRSEPPRDLRSPFLAGEAQAWRPTDPVAYSYLLGLYLGDGCIWEPDRRRSRLGLTLDAKYPRIIETAAGAIERVLPGIQVCRQDRGGCIVLLASSALWPTIFPQHGDGPKHTREIALTDWQLAITQSNPAALVKGLIHSDGSRALNRFSTQLRNGRVARYSYTRYFFTNNSEGIRRIFCDHCDLIGVRWTQSNPTNVSISHRDSVAILDSFIGPKR